MSDRNSFQGNATNSAISFGQNSSASVVNSTAAASPAEAAVRADLENLLSRLQAVAGELTAPDQGVVAGAADEVARELAEPKPRWQRIQTALGRIGPAVATLAKLAGDVARIADAINPLIPH